MKNNEGKIKESSEDTPITQWTSIIKSVQSVVNV